MNCDRIARWYAALEYCAFGPALKRRREAFLPGVSNARRVLVLGDGDGRALAALVRAAPTATVDYVDSSARMVTLARARAGEERVTYHHADALRIALPAAEFDLIVSHFFLDCLNESDARTMISRVAAAAGPGARWIISEFQQPGRWAAWIVHGLYQFFRVTTGLRTGSLVDYGAILKRNGFHLASRESAWGGLLVSDVWILRVFRART